MLTGYWSLLSLLLCQCASHALGLSVSSEFDQRGVQGVIQFSQEAPSDPTIITVNLTGLDIHNDNLFGWHVHQYPFPLNGVPNPCRVSITGGHYDPLRASIRTNYTQECARDPANCEIGDLSGKFGPFNISESANVFAQYSDPNLSLFGVYSIIGRSIVVHFSSGKRLVCANIGYPQNTTSMAQSDILVSSFRNIFAGRILFRGHTDNSTSSVYTDLLRVNGSSNSMGHNWHVHREPLDENGTDCGAAGPHYNPLNVNVSSGNYAELCNSTSQENCEIGDLSSKGAPYDVVDGVVKQFYTDLTLPLAGDQINIVDRSIVIHEEDRGGPRIACANLTRFSPLEAVVNFNESGITGSIRFSQQSLFDNTYVSLNLQGLGGIAGGYHVHVTPVPLAGSPQRCGLAQGHWNPTNIVYDNNITRSLTSDEYEIGDLSGKFGGLNDLDSISATYSDPNVPLFGVYSIVGRSLVIHRADDSSRIACANIELVRPVVRVVTIVNTSSLSGEIVFTQPADDPLSETTITVQLTVLEAINVTAPRPTSTPALVVMSQTSIAAPTSSVPSVQVVSPSPTTQSVPALSTSMEVGSGEEDSLLLPFGPTSTVGVSPTPTPSPLGRRRKRRVVGERVRRQSTGNEEEATFEWSVRMVPAAQDLPADCNSLPVFGSALSDQSTCSPDAPLACSIGNLTGKHGSLSLPTTPGDLFMAVFTDPSLPLSGPQSPFTSQAALLVQQADTVSNTVACSLSGPVEQPPPSPPPVTEAPPTTATPITETTPPPPPETTMQQTTAPPPPTPAPLNGVLIGAVGGVVGALLLALVIFLICCCCYRARQKSEYKVSKQSAVELGTVRPAKPVLGVAQYRALHDYTPQSEDDLQLRRGEWVTLVETPSGGNWWRGRVEDEREGWFPRTYVEYVDLEAEKKKQQDENFLMAASAIVAASSNFTAQHGSLAQSRHQTLPAKTKRGLSFSKKKEEKIELDKIQRSHTTVGRKIDIDSTPRAPRKLDRPYLDSDTNGEATIIPNTEGETVSNGGDKLPDTPVSQRNTAFYANVAAPEGSPIPKRALEKEVETTVLESDQYIAKHDFNGSTDIELELKKGDIVTVIEKADTGWWKGVCEGRVGWFPETYIRPAPLETREEAFSLSTTQLANMEETMKTGGDLEVEEYRSIFPYQSDTEGDLVFAEGDTVLVYWAQDNGWWYGAVGSRQGWFPGSFVEPLIDIPEPFEDRKKESRSSFKKMWSLRKKSRDKTKDSVVQEEEKNEEKLPTASEPASLEGQLQAALERRRSFGRGRTLAVDENAAKGEKTDRGQSRVADFMRRSFKKLKSRDDPKDEAESTETKDSPKDKVELTETKDNSKDTASTPRQEVVPSIPPSKTGTHKRQRLDTKTRRAPPPPPATQAPPTTTPTSKAPPTATASAPVTQDLPSTATPAEATPTSTQLKPVKEEPTPPKTEEVKPSTPQTLKEDAKISAPQISKEDTKPSTPKAKEESAITTRSFSTAQRNAVQPRARPRKRLTTAAGAMNNALPQRRPPPPPPSAAKVATPPATPSDPSSSEVIANTNAEEVSAPSVNVRSKVPPVPPRSTLRPRVQRVKRPISRMIPPPPSIPLPPPPVRKAPKSEATAPVKPKSETTVPIEPKSETTAPVNNSEKRKSSLDRPPVAPKPGHLRRLSTPASPTATTAANSGPLKSPKPKPPPPARTSSLASRPVPPVRKTSPSELPKIKDETEEVDSPPETTESSQKNNAAAKSLPPTRPPPPRPPSAASGKINQVEGQANGAGPAPVGSKVLYSSPDAQPDEKGHSIRSKGSNLMQSLKKMVKRDSKKGFSKESTAAAPAQNGSPKILEKAPVGTASKQDSPRTKPARPPPPKTPPTPQKKDSSAPLKPPSPKTEKKALKEDTASTQAPKPKPNPRQNEPDPPQPKPTPRQNEADPPQPKPTPRQTETDVPPQPKPVPRQSQTDPPQPKPAPRKSETDPPQTKDQEEIKPKPVPRQISITSENKSDDKSIESPQQSQSSPVDTNFYRATKNYTAENDKELSFSKGDVLIIVQKKTDGFHFGMLDDGTTGLFPLHAVEPFLS